MPQIARTICDKFGGDVRHVWQQARKKPLLDILEKDLRVGPALSRMIVGALRDHQLVKLEKSDLKPDRHVCRLMYALRLSSSQKPAVVLAAAQEHFSRDPWLADTALYHLGAEYGVASAKQFWKMYDTVTNWKRARLSVQKRIEAEFGRFCRENDGWEYEPFGSPHWAAAYIAYSDHHDRSVRPIVITRRSAATTRDCLLATTSSQAEKAFAGGYQG